MNNMSSISRNNKQDVMELTWQNGQLALQELELNPSKSAAAAAWGGEAAGDHTLESIVHQATATTFNTHQHQHQQHYDMGVRNWDNDHQQRAGNPSSGHMHAAEQSGGKLAAASGKRVRSEPSKGFRVDESACASASATFCRETDTTMMTWNSFESPRSLKNARINNADDDSVSLYQDCSENQDGERGRKGESCRSQSSARRSRAAAVHNLSERRRRDRINEKMKALQKLVPNASKTDKASMLDEVIEYLKQLQAQIHMMSTSSRNMPQMVMPLGMQQQLQMSILARMGMGMGINMGMNMGMGGMGMNMLDVNNLTRNVPPSFPPLMHAAAPLGTNTTSFVPPPPFPMPTVVPPSTSLKVNADAAGVSTSSMPNFDAYNTFLAQQSMNMEFLNKMSALYRQQNSQQPSKKSVNSLPLPNHDQGG